jgi:hypothetical protein
MKLLTKYERSNQKLAPFSVFLQRLGVAVVVACCIIALVLSLGMAGYHWFGGLDWVDSLLEASMILGGMGPVSQYRTTSVKLFASGYALFSGLVFIALMGVLLTPVVHRILHKFHVE